MPWYRTEKEELSLKIQMVSFRNQKGQSYRIDENGYFKKSDLTAESINLGSLAFQLRYKYLNHMSPGTNKALNLSTG